MRHAAISRVYATALIELAVAKDELPGLTRDLQSLAALLGPKSDFVRFLESPEFGFDQKRRFLERVTVDAESTLTLRFLLLLVRKHREPLLGPIIAMFDHLCDERAGRIRGRLSSARSLTAEELARLESKLGVSVKREVKLSVEVDERLLAGMMLHFEDKTIDGSLRTRLSRMRDKLMTADLGKG